MPFRDRFFWLFLTSQDKNWEGEKFHFPNFLILIYKKKPGNPVPKWLEFPPKSQTTPSLNGLLFLEKQKKLCYSKVYIYTIM